MYNCFIIIIIIIVIYVFVHQSDFTNIIFFNIWWKGIVYSCYQDLKADTATVGLYP